MLDSQIPNFSLPATSGQTFSLNEQSGKIVVIYFYPKDSTPGCTTEAQQFRDLHERSTFVIDKSGVLRREWRGVKVPGHAQEVLDFVKTL